MRWVLGTAFAASGFNPVEAESVEYALQVLRGQQIDIVLTDMELNDGCGCMITDAAFDKDPTIPVIMISARHESGLGLCTNRGNISDFIPKPFDVDVVVRRVTTLMHCSQTSLSPHISDPHLDQSHPTQSIPGGFSQ
ncbi:MAG: response regulator [Ignavibacteriae bacterium]|nr:response regulator [Ignavibacteriota bacterium]